MATRSFDKVIGGWERLLAAVHENEGMFPSAEFLKATLEWHLQEAKAAKARQVQHEAGRKQATRDLRTLTAAGHDAASRLGHMAKSVFGLHDERLVQFGVTPIRQRGSRESRTAKEAPASPGSTGTEAAE